MYRSGHLRVLALTAATISLGMLPAHARTLPSKSTDSPISQLEQDAQQDARADGRTKIHLRWGARPGVARYRLQLATDRGFNDIVFDRVIAGSEYQIDDLAPGAYYWRIAALTAKLGEFSSAAPIEVTLQTLKTNTETQRPKSSSDRASDNAPTPVSGSVIARGGWLTAIGEVTNPVLAHLRSAVAFDVVAVNAAGVTFALDAASGVSLWNTRRTPDGRSLQPGPGQRAVFLIKSRSGLDDIALLSGIIVTRIEGSTGRELWRATLPAFASTAVVLSEQGSSEIFVVDNSLQRLLILEGNTGNIVVQTKLRQRVVGTPVVFNDGGVGRVMFALENGLVEVRDRTGAVIRTGDAVSPATTPPLFVNGPRGGLILVGTRSGLTALSVDDLRPLGRVTITGDAPRGTLAAEDLDGDGVAEVIMITERGRIMAVRAADGKTLWESSGISDAETTAFADVNGDGVRDVLVTGAQTFALVLSGRDGAILWKDNEGPSSAANHASSPAARRVIALPSGSGVLIIGGDASRTGLRAIEFSKARR
jgi:outer membrane protein assembly factor BamB